MQKLVTSFLIAILFFTNSCISRQIKKDSSYKEIFLGYFVSKYGNDLVFIGQKYHYIFQDNSQQIVEFTKSEWKSKLTIFNINIRVDNDNNVNGYVDLQFLQPASRLSKEELLLATQHRFIENNKNIFNKRIFLKGVRYQPARGFDSDFKKSFSRRYEAKIFYDATSFDKITKATMTPVAYAADGLLILAGGIWIPLIIIAMTDDDTPEKIINKIKH
jgi:hypothetical protein